jgi:hypothetical protein
VARLHLPVGLPLSSLGLHLLSCSACCCGSDCCGVPVLLAGPSSCQEGQLVCCWPACCAVGHCVRLVGAGACVLCSQRLQTWRGASIGISRCSLSGCWGLYPAELKAA